MAKVNSHHMIEEIQANVTTGDILKSKIVLAHIGEVDSKIQNRMIYELSKGPVEFVVPLLTHLLSEHSEVTEKMPIIRETLLSSLLAYPEKLPEFLEGDAVADKSELIRVVGELRYTDATQSLLNIAAATDNDAEILLIIEILGQLGDPEAINTLTDYLYSANRELIIAAVQSLGQLGTPTAMHRLAERMGTDNEIDFLILSIFADVQDQVSLDKLNETLRSHYAHMRSYAKKELVNIGPKAVPFLIGNLTHEDPDFLIHTLNVLGDIGDESATSQIRKLIDGLPKSANVRFAAYEALALLPLKKGAYTLTAGLTDSEDHVCVAAARAIDRNFSKILGVGIRNLLRGDEDEAKHIAKIIVNAQVDQIFADLAEDEVFQKLALVYLPHTHEDIREHYYKLLIDKGLTKFAAKIEGRDEKVVRPKVVAVDDSRMILNIYKATLHELGYEPVLFEFPASALEWLSEEKPLMVLTDLNMPDITGVELTEKIRQKYSPDLLPIIMVTTQNEATDNEAAKSAGVNAILHKPFNATSLGDAMDKQLKRK
ncbi:HEAT repeat domain-containing protein [Desulfosediminicola flagellatus]|uniref:HEAT repeat domain-containing protein n=1 Tax=Desulfosediminicola flagellatus TaxID=2569541 RepID=UPI0010ACB5C2|nr:HEAT repeat domain-containing protein [Desulfosediminicola flagellatus]